MSCGNNPQNSAIQKTESITMNLYYTGTDGNARKFVEEMESSGTADAIPAEVKHWHGAAKDSWFQHLTYHKDVQEGASNEWLEAVTNEVYDKL